MKKAILLAALLTVGTVSADVKMGTVDFNKSIIGSKQMAAMKQKMESKFKARRNKIDSLRASLQKEVGSLQRNESVMTQAAIQKKKVAIQKRVAGLEKMERSFQQDLMAFRSEQFQKIVKAFKGSVAKIAKRDGLSVVINQSAIIYTKPGVEDITGSVAESLK